MVEGTNAPRRARRPMASHPAGAYRVRNPVATVPMKNRNIIAII